MSEHCWGASPADLTAALCGLRNDLRDGQAEALALARGTVEQARLLQDGIAVLALRLERIEARLDAFAVAWDAVVERTLAGSGRADRIDERLERIEATVAALAAAWDVTP